MSTTVPYGVHKLQLPLGFLLCRSTSVAAQSRVIDLQMSAYTSMTKSTTITALPAVMAEMREMTSASAAPPTTVPMLMHPQRIPGPSPYADRVLDPPPLSNSAFAFSDFLRKEYRFGMDTSRRRICAFFVQGHCPMGNSCPDKHTVSSSFSNLVCKHWLRGLCKKGDGCEFLHEYNLFPPPSSLLPPLSFPPLCADLRQQAQDARMQLLRAQRLLQQRRRVPVGGPGPPGPPKLL